MLTDATAGLGALDYVIILAVRESALARLARQLTHTAPSTEAALSL